LPCLGSRFELLGWIERNINQRRTIRGERPFDLLELGIAVDANAGIP